MNNKQDNQIESEEWYDEVNSNLNELEEVDLQENSVNEDNDYEMNQKNSDSENKSTFNFKRLLLDLIIYAAVLFISLKIIPVYVIQRTIVDGESMMNTLHHGESLMVEKVSYRFTDIGRNDVIVFYPYGPDIDERYVKRVIGLPNETIQIIGNDVYINNEKVDDIHRREIDIEDPGMADEIIALKDNEYFVMGDNRNHSLDSRSASVGIVPKENIIGKAVLRIWPLNKIGLIK